MRYRWFLAGGAVAVVVLALWVVFGRSGGTVAVNFIDTFADAEKRPNPDVFSIVDATLNGQAKRAIFVGTASRLTWHETIPNRAWLTVSLGLKPEAWTQPGDGVLFRVGMSTGSRYDELLNVLVNPYGNPSDRGWQDISLDLSPYAGQSVDVIFNTNWSAPGHGDDRRNDLALWGAPRIVVR
jgi:hypothetical protein